MSNLVTSPYNVIRLDLGESHPTSNPKEVSMAGNTMSFYSSGSYDGIQIALDEPINDWIPIVELGNPFTYSNGFQKVFLAWDTPQPGKYLRVLVGRGVYVGLGVGSVNPTDPTKLYRHENMNPQILEVTGIASQITSAQTIATVTSGERWRVSVIHMEHGSGDRVLRGLRFYNPDDGAIVNFANPSQGGDITSGLYTTGPMYDLWAKEDWLIQVYWAGGTTDGTWNAYMLYYPETT